MNTEIKTKIVFALLMAFVTSSFISFVIISINVGFVDNFFKIWAKSFSLAYFLVVFAILVISPKVQKISEYIVKKG